MTGSIEARTNEESLAVEPGAPLAARLERLRALRSAFGALAPSAVSDAGHAIAQAGRDLTQRLADAHRADSEPGPDALADIDAALDDFEASMRRLARGVAVAQLRSTLPGRLSSDRRSVLDLLDLLLGQGLHGAANWPERIGAIDYLITLLCTHGARRTGTVAHDPVSLTPRLAAVCAEAEEILDARLDDAEAAFFAAANMDRDELREEFQGRTLRQRKVDLGPLFFAPRVLRAILTYNAALLTRVQDEIHDVADWGVVASASATADALEARGGSVFESARLRRLAAAAGHRARGENAPESPEKRIAAALAFDDLEASELEALGRDCVGTPEDPIGTAILVGLLCRSLAVLSIELQDFGICPDDVSDVWVPELDLVFQRAIDDKHARDAYKQACALSELKNRFLLEPLAEHIREERSLTQAALRPVKPFAGATAPAAPTSPSVAEDAAPTRPLPPAAPTAAPASMPASAPITTPTTAATASPIAATAAASTAPIASTSPHAGTSSNAAAPAANRTGAATTGATAATSAHARSGGASANRSGPPSAASVRAPAAKTARRERARDLVREALEEDQRGRDEKAGPAASRITPIRLVQAALVLIAIGLSAALFLGRSTPDLARYSSEQLEALSPYLVDGQRNGDGHGPGFVGTVDDRWKELPLEGRQSEAEALVSRLRESGLQQVMVFDRERMLRIQAIGSQPVRAL